MTAKWQNYEDTRPKLPGETAETRLGGHGRGPPFYFDVTGGVYVLKLQGDNYYVGHSHDLNQRMHEHFAGEGAYWTQVHDPIAVIQVHGHHEYRSAMTDFQMEKRVTAHQMQKRGIENVRGGPWVHTDPEEWPLLPSELRDGSDVSDLQAIAHEVC